MNTSIMAQTKRDGVLAVHSLDEHVFCVPNLDEARAFYTAFGLDVRNHGDGLALYAHNNPQRYARLIKGEKKRLLWLSFGVYAEDYERFVQLIESRGIERIASPDPESPLGLWIRSNDGFPVQIKVAPKSSPSSPTPVSTSPNPMAKGAHPRARVHPGFCPFICPTPWCSPKV